MLDDLNHILRSNPSITEVDFSKVTKPIPEGVLRDTNVSKVIVSTTTKVGNAFSGVSGLTIEVTGSGTVNSSILGGASGVTLDLSDSGITDIDMAAFKDCTGLASVTFPKGLTYIDMGVFYGCTGLTSVTFPEGLTTIDLNAFGGCTGLTSVTFPEGLTGIASNAFNGCTKLRQVTLPDRDGTFSIGFSAFAAGSGPQPLHLYIPHENTDLTVGYGAFSGRNVTVYYNGSNSKKITSSIENSGGGKVVDIKPYAPAP